jgi:hypothetical protein
MCIYNVGGGGAGKEKKWDWKLDHLDIFLDKSIQAQKLYLPLNL